MVLTDKQRSFLHSVRDFGQTRKYYGMMPAKVLLSIDDVNVHQAYALGLVAFASATVELESEVKFRGIVLTDKGARLLDQGRAEQ